VSFPGPASFLAGLGRFSDSESSTTLLVLFLGEGRATGGAKAAENLGLLGDTDLVGDSGRGRAGDAGGGPRGVKENENGLGTVTGRGTGAGGGGFGAAPGARAGLNTAGLASGCSYTDSCDSVGMTFLLTSAVEFMQGDERTELATPGWSSLGLS